MYIISACLLGDHCKYNGDSNKTRWVEEFANSHTYIKVCPEVMGGLPVPRPPCERTDQKTRGKDGVFTGGRVLDRNGKDVTEAFVKGAAWAWQAAKEQARLFGEEIEGAVLKAKSPSCGSGKIYDGSFSNKVICGDGVFAEFLKEQGIPVYDENSIKEPEAL